MNENELFLQNPGCDYTDILNKLKGFKVLFLDVDETLARTQDKLAELLKKRHGISVEFSKMTKRKIQYAITKCESKFSSEDEIEDCCFDVLELEETYADSMQYLGYAELARSAHASGVKTVTLTHRAHVEEKYPHTTRNWFLKNKIPVDFFVFGGVQQKADFLKVVDNAVGEHSAFCDDDPDTIRLCKSVNLKNIFPFLVSDRPWTEPATSELDLSGLIENLANPDQVGEYMGIGGNKKLRVKK